MTCFHESLYIQYSISDDIVMTHNFALAFKYNCSRYLNPYFPTRYPFLCH